MKGVVEFISYKEEEEVLTLEEAKEKLFEIIPSADLTEFEEKLLSGMHLGFNDNWFRLINDKKYSDKDL